MFPELNKSRTQQAKKNCLSLCRKHNYTLLKWGGSVNMSNFVCNSCKTKFCAVYDRLRAKHTGCGVCKNLKIAKSICLKLGYAYKMVSGLRTRDPYFKVTCYECGHIFKKAVPSTSIYKLVCPCKNGNNIKSKKAEVNRNKFCKKNGIKIVTSFLDGTPMFIFRFKCGHLVKRRWDNLKQGHLDCPECATTSKIESKLRVWLNRATKYKWFSERPIWLKNPKTNKTLELDIYSEELGIAIEYNGEQHYKVMGGFFSKEELLNRKYLDNLKIKLCIKNKVKLIVLDERDFNSVKEAKAYLRKELPKDVWK